MPPAMSEHYANKILLFQKWWINRGYPSGIPDEAPYALEAKRLAPSWRRICKSLLRNDYWCKGLGFSQQKSDAYRKYQELMRKRKEKWGVDDASVRATQDMMETLDLGLPVEVSQ
jgi:predicted phosphoadenosine phosphosulfate sulfurtransferase